MDLTWFNAAETEPMGAKRTAVPAGEYQVVITESEERRTKSGTGTYLGLTLEIIDGPHKGGKLWANVNMQNPSAAAVTMGQRELSSICRATGKMAPRDSRELHDLPILVTVILVTVDVEGERNRITAWAPRPASSSVAVVGSTIRIAPQTQPGVSPWKRQ